MRIPVYVCKVTVDINIGILYYVKHSFVLPMWKSFACLSYTVLAIYFYFYICSATPGIRASCKVT